MIKKLIEVALPLEKINAASAREKSIRHGHPSTLHLWWARRPLATARAVIWSSLVDDPSSHPELFPTKEDQDKERQRLFRILEDLVVWENSNNEDVLNKAKAEILKYTGGKPPALLDPFAGGGSIPLEAQRLGLEAHAHDLNPVAVLINKAMIEIPPRFAGMPPVNPESRAKLGSAQSWKGAQGLAEDVRYYGEWMKQEAFKQIGHLYPKVSIPKEQGGGEATVLAWIWARTIKCPNPACGCTMPLASSFILSKKKGHEFYITPVINKDEKKIYYKVNRGKQPEDAILPKTSRGAKFKCIFCGESVDGEYLRREANSGKMSSSLMAIVAEGNNERLYLSPTEEQEQFAIGSKIDCDINQPLAIDPRAIWCVNYGLDTFDKLYTSRQLTMFSTMCNLIHSVKEKIVIDISASGSFMNSKDISAYPNAICVYLSFLIDKMADYHSSICSWNASGEKIRNTFGRQGIPMVWDYAECNPFCNSSGSYSNMLEWVYKAVSNMPHNSNIASCLPFDAQSDCGIRDVMISTDPPYYDNIGYANLSDYFYVWLRNNLKTIYPDLFSTLLVPKSEELVAIQYRFNGSKKMARDFFECGMFQACEQIYKYSSKEYPVTIYYAYKQGTSLGDSESSGWETMLSAIIRAGFMITGTWPVRTEMASRSVASGANALASSIVLVCRKKPLDTPSISRRAFINELHRTLRTSLRNLQSSNIAPVDLAQSAIGPGMAIFSKYSKVLEADGTSMTIRTALQIINQELDYYFNDQEGDLDSESRFCVDLYTQYAFNDMKYGEADTLARARNISISNLADVGVLHAQKGIVRLLSREELSTNLSWDPSSEKVLWMVTQHLTRAMEKGGTQACAEIISRLRGNFKERSKDLIYRLFTIADSKGWNQEAYAYNSLIVSWPDIENRVALMQIGIHAQTTLFENL